MGRLVILVVMIAFASSINVSKGNRNWQYGWGNPYNYKHKFAEKKINVGGSSNWTFGFNYARWAFQYGVFYVNDTLVFKYEAPSENNTHPHSVYLLPDFWRFKNCDLTNALKVANESQGVGDGFSFKLEKWRPYFFLVVEEMASIATMAQ